MTQIPPQIDGTVDDEDYYIDYEEDEYEREEEDDENEFLTCKILMNFNI